MNSSKTTSGKLVIIPTPIGNLADITLRALECLKTVDVVFAEDTRHTLKLFKHYQIHTPLRSYHQYNEHQIKNQIIERIINGEVVGLVSDAGTPGISDPGFLVIRECIRNSIPVECLPGPTALIPAIVQSGFSCDRFVFEGFLPHKKGRKARLNKIAHHDMTTILYESPHRIIKTLHELAEVLGKDRPICLCKEITKIHESTLRGTIEEILTLLNNKPVKGEIVLIIGTSKDILS